MKRIVINAGGRVQLNTEGLAHLRQMVTENKDARVKVGLLGKGSSRKRLTDAYGPVSNPDLGLIHEFGTEGIPARSFLRMPLGLHLKTEIQKVGAAKWARVILVKGIPFALNMLGQLARNTIMTAFETRGFGNWQPNAPYTIKKKKSDAPLIDTAQMRKAVAWQVVGVDGQTFAVENPDSAKAASPEPSK